MRKRASAFIFAVLVTAAANAQTAYDAWLFSENNYEGTARSVAMGNAFTALGGDLGGISINPAGSAVAGYSQVSLTPSVTFSSNTAVGAPLKDTDQTPYFQREMKSQTTRAGLSNVGFTFNFKTGRTSGLKSVTAGFVMNRSNTWCENVYTNGTNSQTSFLAAAAVDATDEIAWLNEHKAAGEPDFTKEDFMAENAYDYMKWKDVVGYRGGLFSAIGADGKSFIAPTERLLTNGEIRQSGQVEQTYGRSVNGSKYEYLINVGANISDFVYVGFNLGINSLSYDYTHYFTEAAPKGQEENFENLFVDGDGKETMTYFKKGHYKYSYSADGYGVFAKLGAIVTPGAGFRFGAAIQTPSSLVIREEFQELANTEFTDPAFNGDAKSELGYSSYQFNSPWRFNLGVAKSIARMALVSVDYEVATFRGMRFQYEDNTDEEYAKDFDDLNKEIKDTYGAAHYLRLGAEVKPISVLAVRAGYNLSTSAQKKYYDNYYEEYISMPATYAHSLSFGVGYISKGSFFADIACRYAFAQNEYIYPYSDYRKSEGILSPEILNRHSNWKLLATVGWRF